MPSSGRVSDPRERVPRAVASSDHADPKQHQSDPVAPDAAVKRGRGLCDKKHHIGPCAEDDTPLRQA